MTNKNFGGTGVALVTPFDDNNSVDYGAFKKLLNHVTSGGADYLVVLGTTSESPTLTKAEKDEIVRFVVEYNNSRLPIVLGMGGNNTEELSKNLLEGNLEGIDAILSVAPYYNKPSQGGMFQHFIKLADASPVPVILYNVPARTGANLSAETTLRLAEHQNIIASKEASNDLEQCAVIVANCPSDFSLISGDDMHTLPIISIGGIGVISVIANALPNHFCAMVKNSIEGKSLEAVSSFYQLVELTRLIFREGNPAGVKGLLKQLDICDDGVRLPLISASNGLTALLAEELVKLRA